MDEKTAQELTKYRIILSTEQGRMWVACIKCVTLRFHFTEETRMTDVWKWTMEDVNHCD